MHRNRPGVLLTQNKNCGGEEEFFELEEPSVQFFRVLRGKVFFMTSTLSGPNPHTPCASK